MLQDKISHIILRTALQHEHVQAATHIAWRRRTVNRRRFKETVRSLEPLAPPIPDSCAVNR